MITRRNLAEQLRDYQLQSKRHWSSLAFWSSVNRSDETTSPRWRVLTIILLLSTVAWILYRQNLLYSLYFLGVAIALLLTCRAAGYKIMARRKQKRVLPY